MHTNNFSLGMLFDLDKNIKLKEWKILYESKEPKNE